MNRRRITEWPDTLGHSLTQAATQFVQSLGNPFYLNHLAVHKYLDDSAFVAYLDYLKYFARPEYAKFLSYPGPTLKALELLGQERFRKDILMPGTVATLVEGGMRAAVDGR